MYQALYRKYRPQTFDDVVGQPGVTQTLKNQMLNGRLSHAYLFTGSRGTGKTTCAKILAKAVNCENPDNGNPCNCCPACKSIDSGACMDVLEIDAASNNSVDNVRNIRDEAVYTPAEVQKRVYIIDEVHMLSMSAFNALLKLIEEPPSHLLFILATTELHKVPATILSRCQRFAFRRLLPEDITDRLNYIAYKEQIDLEPDAAAYIARLADGGMRDAVSLLDQCASSVTGSVTADKVCSALGLAGTRSTAQMLTAIAQQDATKVLELFNAQYAEGKDLAAMLDELCTVARDLLILRTADQSSVSMISGICTQEELRSLMKLFSPGELLRMTAMLRDTASGFNTSANRRIDAELCLIRLCEPQAELNVEALNARLSRLENRIADGMIVSAAAVSQEEQPAEASPVKLPVEQPTEESPTVPDEAPPGFWHKLIERLRVELKISEFCIFTQGDDAPVTGYVHKGVLILQAKDSFTLGRLNQPNILQKVAMCASGILGATVRVQLEEQRAGAQKQQEYEKLMGFAQDHSDIIKIT